jgi:hypothetical protein
MLIQTSRLRSINQNLTAGFAGRSTPFVKTQSIRASLTDTTQTNRSTREVAFASSSTRPLARTSNHGNRDSIHDAAYPSWMHGHNDHSSANANKAISQRLRMLGDFG